MPPPRILITRSPHQASALADSLRAHGAEPILIPTIELAPPSTFAPLDTALTHLDHFHWLIFTSANAVEAFAKRLAFLEGTGFSPPVLSGKEKPVILSEGAGHHPAPQPKDPPPIPHPALPPDALNPEPSQVTDTNPPFMLPPTLQIAAIGPATAAALVPLGTKPPLLPPHSIAESLAQTLLPYATQPDGAPTRFLLIRAETARDHLPETLRAAGADITIALAYRTILPPSSIAQLQALFATPSTYPDAITFTSSSTIQNLLTLLESANLTLPPSILRASIGPITSQTLRDLGYPPHAEAAHPTIPSLVEILVKGLHLKEST